MAFDVMVPLKAALDEITYDNDIRAVVLTGAGSGFSSGADHKSAGSVPHVTGLTRPTVGLRSMEVLYDVILALRKLHQPVIAAVNRAAIGGGLCLALGGRHPRRVHRCVFPRCGTSNGLTASELGLSYLLPRAIGSSRASGSASSRTCTGGRRRQGASPGGAPDAGGRPDRSCPAR